MPASRLQVEQILCPTDFSLFSARALRHAVALTRWFEARLSVVHVLSYFVPSAGFPEIPGPILAAPTLRSAAAEHMDRFIEPALAAGVPVRTEIREGDAWRGIRDAARELPADLVVMGTHGRSGFERLLLGSVAEKVLRTAPCPVMTVCHDQPVEAAGPAFRRILCATDLSASSSCAIELALSLAEESEAQVTLLHVVEGLPDTGRLQVSLPEMGPLRQDLEARARELLRGIVPPEAREWCEVQERVSVGRAHREILRVAAEESADVIVLGTHGHGAIEQLFFGSTSHHVVRGAGCPVLTVPPVRVARAGDRVA